ncbi:MAG: helix-turn-helix transcriptional regulator [Bacteroidetes bacterium]|nr:helix-turn-helix transcriptional regulator [Bacteroidota bacterium]
MTFYEQQVRQLRDAVYPRGELSRQIVAAKQYIDQHFAEELDLNGIARRALISKFHFLRLFKLHYGVTPHRYLTEVRLLEARRLLLKGMPVTEVCVAVGFEGVTSFKGLFKRYWGATPASWKKSNFRDRAAGKV